MRGCLLRDDGTVNYYLRATNWAYKEDGVTSSNLTGTDGQVMIEIPKFWYRYAYSGTTHTYEVSPVPLTGFKVHEMFMTTGTGIITGTDSTFAGANNWANVDINAFDASTDLTVTATAAGQYCTLPIANAGTTIGKEYQITLSVANLVGTWTIKDFTGTQVLGQITANGSGRTFTFRALTTGGIRLVADTATASMDMDNITLAEVIELDYVYVGAYEGVLYDNSESKYVGACHQTAVSAVFASADKSITIASRTGWATNLTVGQKLVISGTTNNNATVTIASIKAANAITVNENLTDETAATTVIQSIMDATATTGDKLSSVSGFLPITGNATVGSRAHFRQFAANRGAGWSQEFADVMSGIQLLIITEYASFYTQSVLGYGIAAVGDWPA